MRRLWHDNTGALIDQQGRDVRLGLCMDSSDLIGLRSLVVTSDLLGQPMARFVTLEVRTAHGVVGPEQRAFLRPVEEAEHSFGTPSQVLPGH